MSEQPKIDAYTSAPVPSEGATAHTHVLRSQDTGRVIARVTVPADTPADRIEFVARNLACQQGVRGVQWLTVNKRKVAA
jgi:hypothetical protein